MRGLSRAPSWDASLHPRDRLGQFVEKFDVVDLFEQTGGHLGRGRVVGSSRGPGGHTYLAVELDGDRGTVRIAASRVETAPEEKARLVTPAYREVAPGPDVDTPIPPGVAIRGTHYEGMHKPTEAMTYCAKGHKHWGTMGAAGMLIRNTDETGVTRYLLQKRSPYVQLGNTWSVPGGAITPDHPTPLETGLVEALEELGEIPEVTPARTVTVDHGGWAYTTVIADSPTLFDPAGQGSTAWEQTAVGWFTREEFDDLDLHPGFESTLPVIDRSGGLTAAAGPDNLVNAIKKAIPNWDPAKHPRDRIGQFLEVGDYVHAYTAPNAPPVATGKVAASYFDEPTGRLFIGVDVNNGELMWVRPKQLENVAVKAKISAKTPDLPIPAVDEKVDFVKWDTPIVAPMQLGQSIPDESAAVHLTDLAPGFKSKIGINSELDKPAPSTVPQVSDIHIPAGKTADDVLWLVATSFENKQLPYPGGPAAYNIAFQDMLDDPDFNSAEKKLNKLMTAAKLGGKQRSRYKGVLAYKHGGHQAVQVLPEPEPEPAPKAVGIPPPELKGSEEWDIWLTKMGYDTLGNSIDVFVGPHEVYVADSGDTDNPTAPVVTGYTSDGIEVGHPGYEVTVDAQHVYNSQDDPFNDPGPETVPEFETVTDPDDELTSVSIGGPGHDPSAATTIGPPLAAEEMQAEVEAEVEAEQLLDALTVKSWAHDIPISAESSIYSHPQGSVIEVDNYDNVTKYGPDGKKKSTSATPEKLSWGHGGWSYVGSGKEAFLKATGASKPPVKKTAAKKVAPSKSAIPKLEAKPDPYVEAKATSTLNLLGTTMVNEGLNNNQNTIRLETVLQAKSYDEAITSLNELMTALKLGGNQRKRYKQALADKTGHTLDTPAPAAKAATGPSLDPSTGVNPANSSTWRPIKASAGTGQATPGVIGPTKGNTLVKPPGVSPQAAKGSIQQKVSARMLGKVTAKQMASAILDTKYSTGAEAQKLAKLADGTLKGSWRVQKQTGTGNWVVVPASAADPPSSPGEIEKAMRQTLVNMLVANWASSSNDSNVRSLALQEAATKEFGLTGAYDWPSMRVETRIELRKHEALFRTFLRAMHEETQDWAKKNDIKYVKLRRGMKVTLGKKGSVVNLKLRPLSSFTTDASVASRFGTYVSEAIVPIEWVIGTAITGYGCQNEYEWVVLGGTHQVRVLS